ncbi:MAG: type II secretion system F family protein [Patescibacteria group bacterium]|nr:type II secretion system F family protein [Patescibacteria group bacterium]
MPTFKYVAKDSQGATKKGSVEASNKARAIAVMQERGLIPISIHPKREFLDLSSLKKKLSGVTQKEKVVFTRQLATMVGAGLPLTQALSILRDQAGDTPFGDILEYIVGEVEGGKPLSEAMRKFPDVFSSTYTALVEAAEASGAIKKVLLRLAQNLEKENELRQKIKGALFYPAMVLTAMVGVAILLLVFVIPQLKSIYTSFDAELPIATRFFLGVSDFAVKRWWLVIALVAGLIFAFRWFRNTERGRYFTDELVLKLPIFGPLVKQMELVEMTRTLSLLLTSGVPILDSLNIVYNATENVMFRDALGDAREIVKHGESLAAPISGSEYFPPLVSRMIRVGEESGELGEVLLKVAEYFEGEAEHTVENLTTALEPVIMIILGVGVGFMVLSIIMPIYNLTSQF